MSTHSEMAAATWRERATVAERQLLDRALADVKKESEQMAAEQARQEKKEREARDAALATEVEMTRRASWTRHRSQSLGAMSPEQFRARLDVPAKDFDVDRDFFEVPNDGTWPPDDSPANHHFVAMHSPLHDDVDVSATNMGRLLAQMGGARRP